MCYVSVLSVGLQMQGAGQLQVQHDLVLLSDPGLHVAFFSQMTKLICNHNDSLGPTIVKCMLKNKLKCLHVKYLY